MAQFTNRATLLYKGTVTNSNVVSGEIRETLTLEKTAILETYKRNGTVTYLVSIVNSGATGFTSLTLSDNLGEYPLAGGTNAVPLSYENGSVKYYINGVLQTAPTPAQTSPLVFEGLSIPAGASAILVYEASANEYAPLGAEDSVTNTATVSGGGLPAELTASATVLAQAEPVLSITKSLCPAQVSENGEISYTFYIQNTGNTEVTVSDDLSVKDNFNPIIDIISVQLNGTALTATTDYTYDTATGDFATVPGKITVPAATFSQNAQTGVWTVSPGVSTLVINGIV